MTDLVQKIADAVCNEFDRLGSAQTRPILEEVIAEALADAGGAVAFRVDGPYTDQVFRFSGQADAFIQGLLKGDPEGEYKVAPLYTHPDSGRVAELERVKAEQLAKIGDLLRRNAALEQQLTESREQVWEFAERLTATRRALCDVRLKTREGSIVWKIADAALAADKEKNDAR